MSVLIFLYPIVVKTNINFYVVAILVLLSAIPSVLRFFFQGKYTILLNADNKAYVLNLFSTTFNTVSNIIKILLILNGRNVVSVQISFVIINILQLIAVHLYVKRTYPTIDFRVKADLQSISKKKSVMIHEISSTILNNTDVLLLTIFCGLKVVSVYTIYNMIFVQTGFIIKTIATGLTASFGQLYFEDKKKFQQIFNIFESYYQAMVFAVFITAVLLTTPFLKLYTNGVTDIQYIDKYLPFLFMLINILSNVRWPSVIAISIAGHFKETQWRALLETSINLILSLILVRKMGIHGVLIATIVALSYRSVDMILYSNKYILKNKRNTQIKRLIIYGILGFILAYIYNMFNFQIQNYFVFFLTAIPIFFFITLIYFSIAILLNKYEESILTK